MIAMTNTKTPCPNCGGRGYTRHFAGIDHFLNEWDGWEMEKRECRECKKDATPEIAPAGTHKLCSHCRAAIIARTPSSLWVCNHFAYAESGVTGCDAVYASYGCTGNCGSCWCQSCYDAWPPR